MPAHATTPPPVKVLFIAGWGRSGTTILDNIIGSHDKVFTAGEVFHLWRWGFLEHRECGCGQALADCELWRSVLKTAFGDEIPDATEMVALQRRVTQVRRTPVLLAGARSKRVVPDVVRYTDALSRLYTAMGQVAGARVVVDASKRPSDAVLAGLVPGIEPYLLHVVRDPRAVAFSWQRQTWIDKGKRDEMTRHGLLMNAGHWVIYNLGAEAARAVYPRGRYLRLRYEDFMSDPRGSIDRVFAHLGEQAEGATFLDDRTVVLPANHTVAGNPSRYRTGEVRLTPDTEWTAKQDVVSRRGTTTLTLPLLRHYGYPIRVSGVDRAGSRRLPSR